MVSGVRRMNEVNLRRARLVANFTFSATYGPNTVAM